MIENIFHVAQAAAEVAATETHDTGVLGTLGINWKLFIAQLVNFSIILAVLWKWVFVPVSKKLQERSEKIDKALKDADDIELEKIDFEKWKDEEIMKAKKEAAEILNKVSEEAAQIKETTLIQTRDEQSKLLARSQEQISVQQAQALNAIKTEVADMVVLATEKILKQKLNDKHDMELIRKTVEELSKK